MSRNKVEIVGVNTADIKVLNNDEMIYYFKKLKEGDMNAKDILVNGNLKLVLSILKKYNNRCDNMNDLFQVGCIGLIKAIDNFDLNYDVKFSTYAVPMIVGEIKRYLRDNTSSLRISRSIKDMAYHISLAKENLINKLNREPTIKELADVLNISEYEISEAIDSMKDTVSLFEPIYSDDGNIIYLTDQLEDKYNIMSRIDNVVAIDTAINNLKEKEKYIIKERYITGKTQMELSEELGISQAQISRIEKTALNNIKKNIT